MKTRHALIALLLLLTLVTTYALVTRANSSSHSIDLTNWKLTLPVGGGIGTPIEIKQPQLATYQSKYFENKAAGIRFYATADGATTEGSDFARTELREMTDNGTEKASWSNDQGVHVMEITQSIDHLPKKRPAIVAGQIHGTSEYVALIRLEGSELTVKTPEKGLVMLDNDYSLGDVFTVRLEAADGKVKVYYNDELKFEQTKECGSCYFKAGAYLQSNPSWGDGKDSYGRVTIYDLDVTHRSQ